MPRPSNGLNGKLTVHDATQMITSTAGSLARVFGLEPDQVRVLSPFVGGGFGGKGLWSHQILAAAASKLAGRAGAAGAEPRGRLSPGRRAARRRCSGWRWARAATAGSTP